MRILGETTKVGFAAAGSSAILAEPGEGNRYIIYNVMSCASSDGFILKAFKDGESDIDVMHLPGDTNQAAPILNCAKPFEWPVGYGVKANESVGATVIYQLLEG